LGTKCTEFYTDSFEFDTSIVHCLGVYFFYRTECTVCFLCK